MRKGMALAGEKIDRRLRSEEEEPDPAGE